MLADALEHVDEIVVRIDRNVSMTSCSRQVAIRLWTTPTAS